MVLRSTQPITEFITMNFNANNLTVESRMSRKCGSLGVSQPHGPPTVCYRDETENWFKDQSTKTENNKKYLYN
jgi:hypothetical protein